MCVCVLCKNNKKECRVGKAFVRIARAATQRPCSPSLQALLLTTTAMCSDRVQYQLRAGHQGSTSFCHSMTTGFSPFKLPTRRHLWKKVGPLPLVRSPAVNKVRRSHLCTLLVYSLGIICRDMYVQAPGSDSSYCVLVICMWT